MKNRGAASSREIGFVALGSKPKLVIPRRIIELVYNGLYFIEV
jgi:hypothetical protein